MFERMSNIIEIDGAQCLVFIMQVAAALCGIMKRSCSLSLRGQGHDGMKMLGCDGSSFQGIIFKCCQPFKWTI